LLAKISTLLTAKAVTVAAATTCVLTAGTVTAYEAQQAPVKQAGPTVAAAAALARDTKPTTAPGSARRGSQGNAGSSVPAACSTAIAGVHVKASGTAHDQASRLPAGQTGAGARHPGTRPVPHLRIPAAGRAHNQAMRIQNGRRHPRPARIPGIGTLRHQRPLPQSPQATTVPPVIRPTQGVRPRPLLRKASEAALRRSERHSRRVGVREDVVRSRAGDDRQPSSARGPGQQPRAGNGARPSEKRE
jgi:hypothetical protein